MADIGPETTIDSQTVYAGKLITVRKDQVQLPSGGTTEREIVEHQETIAVLPVLDDGRLVMVRQYRKAAERDLLELPAGGIDGDETPEQAVKREMKEETGYDVGRVEHLVTFYTSPGFTTELMHLYRATDLTPGEPTEETDQLVVALMTAEDALREVIGSAHADSKTVLGLLWQLSGR